MPDEPIGAVGLKREPIIPKDFLCPDPECGRSCRVERTDENPRNGHTRLLWCESCKRYRDWYERLALTDRFPFLTEKESEISTRNSDDELHLATKCLIWGGSFRDVTELPYRPKRKHPEPEHGSEQVVTQPSGHDNIFTLSPDYYEAVRAWLFRWAKYPEFVNALVALDEDSWTPHLVETAIKFLREEWRATRLDGAARGICDDMSATADSFCAGVESALNQTLKHKLDDQSRDELKQIAAKIGPFRIKLRVLVAGHFSKLDKIWDASKPTTQRPILFTAHTLCGFYSPARRDSALGRSKLGRKKAN